jgi:hypothetical protein
MGVGSDSGSAESVTRAGVSGIAGHADIRTGDESGGINPIVDVQQLEAELDARVAITGEFGQQATRLVGDIAQTRLEEALSKRLDAELALAAGDSERAAQLNAEADRLQADWGDSGTLRLAAHTVIGALTGGTQGATGAAVGTLSAPVVANALKDAGIEGPLADSLIALASTATGAIAGGTQGGAAAFNEVMNNYLAHPEAKRLQELNRLLEEDDSLTEAERQALEEERLAIHVLSQSRDRALEEACGQGGSAQACSYERALLQVAMDSWQGVTLGREERDTIFAEYLHTARQYGEHQQQRMERIGAEALTEMVVDSISAPIILGQLAGQALLGDEESQALLREMGQEIKALFTNPANYLTESAREQLAQADALEQAGQLDEADRLRLRVALENQTMLMGTGGLVASLPRLARRVVTSRSGMAGGGGFQDGGVAPNMTVGVPNLTERGTLTNLRPGDAVVLQNTPRILVQDSAGRYWLQGPSGNRITPSGSYDFVTLPDGTVRIARPNTNPDFSTHLGLSEGGEVSYAGSIRFANNSGADRGKITQWSNSSGHYQPPATLVGNAGLPVDLFSRH